MPLIVKINRAVQGCGVALPNRSVLAPVEKLNQQSARFHVILLAGIVDIFALSFHPFLNIGLIVAIEAQAVAIHFEADYQVGSVVALLISKKTHPRDDRFFDDLIGHRGILHSHGTHDIERPILFEITPVAIIILNRQFLVAKAG